MGGARKAIGRRFHLSSCSFVFCLFMLFAVSVLAETDTTRENAIQQRMPGANVQSAPKDLNPRTGGMPMSDPSSLSEAYQANDERAGPPRSERPSALEERLPGVEITTDPKDLTPRTGGMPMEVPIELDQPLDTREAAILRRQKLLNRFKVIFRRPLLFQKKMMKLRKVFLKWPRK